MSQQFLNYPPPKEGPVVSYNRKAKPNPVIRGRLLKAAAYLVSSSSLLSSLLLRNNDIHVIHEIPELRDYEPRYNPTVNPIAGSQSTQATTIQDIHVKPRYGNGYYTSADYRSFYLSGKLTPTAVVNTLFPLIRRDCSSPGEHSTAFLDSRVDLIRQAAAESTRRYENGKSLGPLDGVPVTVKDELDIAGYKRTLGSKMDFTGSETSWCAKKWQEGGAIIIGKTNMHEFGLDTTNNNPLTGTPLNPHNPHYYTGGSSGGSAYAVSVGLVPIAHGTDGGGSIRLPANYCGLYGLKTSHGRVSDAPTLGMCSTTAVHGPIAASLDDLTLAYRIMAEPDEGSGFPSPMKTVPTQKELATRPKVIGLYESWIDRSDPQVLNAFYKTIDYYRHQQGYKIVDISIPHLPEGQKAHALTILSEISSGILSSDISKLTPANQIMVSIGRETGASDFLAAQKLRNLLMRHLAFLFQQYPGMIIATPTTPTVGSKINGGEADLRDGICDPDATLRSMEYVYLANFTGCPAITFPMGYSKEAYVPVGLMGMGEWGSEEMLIQFARDAEVVQESKEGIRKPTAKTRGENHGVDWEDILNRPSS